VGPNSAWTLPPGRPARNLVTTLTELYPLLITLMPGMKYRSHEDLQLLFGAFFRVLSNDKGTGKFVPVLNKYQATKT